MQVSEFQNALMRFAAVFVDRLPKAILKSAYDIEISPLDCLVEAPDGLENLGQFYESKSVI
jgi:hypothetical protein